MVDFQKISKEEAAKRQMITAVDLLLGGGDIVSIHTLAFASHGILEPIAQRLDRKSLRLQFLDKISEITWERRTKEAANFFKHGGRKNEKFVYLSAEYTEWVLLDTVKLYKFITKETTPHFYIYALYMYSKYPIFRNLITSDELSFKEVLGGKTYRDKEWFLRRISLLTSAIKSRAKKN